MADSVSSKVEKGFNDLSNSLNDIGKSLKSGTIDLEALTQALKEATGVAGGSNFKTLSDQLEKMVKSIDDMSSALQKIGTQKTNVKGVVDAINGLKKFEFRTSGSKKINGGIGQLNKDLATTAQRVSSVVTKLKDLKSWMSKINSGGGFKVKINNKGFTNVISAMTEMNKAISNFHARKGNNRKNFFEVAFGTQQDNSKEAKKLVTEAQTTIKDLQNSFGTSFGESLRKKLQSAIKEGITKGVEEGLHNVNVSGTSQMTTFLGEFSKATKLSQYQKGDMFQAIARMNGAPIDPWLIKQAELRSADSRYKIDRQMTAKENIARNNKTAELDALFNRNPEEIKQAAQAYAQAWITKLKMVEKQYEQLIDKEKKGRKARENYYKDVERFQKQFQEYQGRELTNYDKVRLKAGAVVEKWEELHKRAENNKYDQSQLYNLMERMTKVTRELAEETYKVTKNYDKLKEQAQKTHKILSGTAQVFNRMSQTISFAGQLFSTLRAQAQNLFGYLRNSIRSLTSQLRGQLNSALSDGIDQFKKMEAAKISFDQFFGENRSDDVISEVRTQALKTPIVTSGELADYVSQLAPVSNGNASLAINASLGALKAIAASGSSTADMEYVIKNIRDVISKGKATAIDIRQFNRAMPALEKFIEKMGLTEFLTDDGDQRNLNITSENVGRVLDMFAHLNTDEDSPIKDINEKQLDTLQGMLQLMKERKTTMVENVLKNGGVFDFAKKVMGVGSSSDLWDSMEKFFTKHVKNAMKAINDINWKEIGERLSEGAKRISSTLRSAYDEVKTLFKDVTGLDDTKKGWDILWSVIENFINGFKEGVKQALQAYNTLKGIFGEDTLKNLASSVGYLVSPMGKIVDTMIKITRQFVGGVGNAFGVMDAVTKWGYTKRLSAIEKAAGSFADSITSTDINGLKQLLDSKGNIARVYGNTAVSGGNVYRDGKLISSGWKEMSIVERAKTVGVGNYTKGIASNVGSKLVSIGSSILSCVSSVALISVISSGIKAILGAGDSTISGSIINGISGAIAGGKLASTIGTALGAAGLGPVGAMAGAVLGVVIPYVNALKREREERERQANAVADKHIDEDKENWVQQIVSLYNENGGKLDEGSNEGKYALNALRKYAEERNLRDLVAEEGLRALTNADYFSKMSSKIAAIDDTDEWAKLYGSGRMISDWDAEENREIRTKLAELTKKWKLLGSPIEEIKDADGNVTGHTDGDYNYNDSTPEQIVRDLLAAQDEQLSEAQFNYLMTEAEKIEKETRTTTIDIFNAIRDNMQPTLQSIDRHLANIEAMESARSYENGAKHTKDAGINENMATIASLESKGRGDLKAFMGADSGFFTDNRLGSGNLNLIGVKNQEAPDNVKELDLYKNPSWTAIYDFLDSQYNKTANQMKELSASLAAGQASPMLEANLEMANSRLNQIYDLAEELRALPNTAQAYVDFLKKLRESYTWMFNFAGGFIKNKRGMNTIFRAGGGPARGVDVVPAMLQPGEFVVRKSGVARAGLSALTALNRGDLMTAARSLGNQSTTSYNNSRNWSNVVNNNQRSAVNNIRIFNRNNGARLNSYHSLANRIALA